MNVTYNGEVYTLPDLQCMVLGVPNAGKSEFASTAEKPMLVFATDPTSKLQAYFSKGIVEGPTRGQYGQPIWIVRSVKTGKPTIQIEGYYDEDELNPQAMGALLARLRQVSDEVRAGQWRTFVLDSWTQVEWIARQRRTYGAMASSDSPYLGAMDDLKSMVNARLMNLACNLIVIFHIETKVVKNRKGEVIKDSRQDMGGGELSYSIAAIGQLKNLANVFGECYLAIAPVDGSDNYALVTRRTSDFRILDSRIKAPNPVKNEWNALFGPWLEREAEKRAVAAAREAVKEAGE